MNPKKFKFAAGAVALGICVGATVAFSSNASAVSSTSRTASVAKAEHEHRKGPNPYAYLPKVPSFKVVSTTVKNGRPLPLAQLSGIFGVPGGKDISPQLSWSGFPAQTKSFVVSMYDPQAPTGSGFWHWVVEDIAATTTSLPVNAGALNSTALPAGAIQLDGDAGTPRYIGGAPPAGSGVHEYYITITALDVASTGLGATASGALLGFTIDSHTIARATLVCPTSTN
jgi:Raf kinase inhibitor-like YbhB/YbcL family protein